MLQFGDPLQAYLSVGYVLSLRKPRTKLHCFSNICFQKKMAHLRDQSASMAFWSSLSTKLEPPLSFAGVTGTVITHESKWPSAQIDYAIQQLGTAVSKTSSPANYKINRWCSQVCPSKKDGQEQHKDNVVLLHVMLGLKLGPQTANVHVK